MPLPLVAASFGGVILSALTAFFATKIPQILAALGLSAVVYKGLDALTGMLITSVQAAVSDIGALNFESTSIDVLGILGAAGLWDSINIVLSGYVSVGMIKATRLVFQTVNK